MIKIRRGERCRIASAAFCAAGRASFNVARMALGVSSISRGMISVSIVYPILFYGSGGQALHKEALTEQIEKDHRQGCNQRTCHDQRLVDAEGSFEQSQTRHQRFELFALQKYKSNQQFIPYEERIHDHQCDERGRREWKGDPP